MKRTLLGSALLLAAGTVLALGPAAAAQSPDRASLPAIAAASDQGSIPLAAPTAHPSPSVSPSTPAHAAPRAQLASSGVQITKDDIGVGGAIQSLFDQYPPFVFPPDQLVKGFVAHGADLTGGHYNLLLVRSDARFDMNFSTVRASAILTHSNGIRFNLWIFDQGTFTLHSDGGWTNWGFYGRFNSSGGNVNFYRLPGGPVVGKDGKCLDVRGSGTANGTPVQIYHCNNTNAQWWDRDGLAVKALGKCLDANGASTGALVWLWDCNGSAPQQWYYENGQLRNAQWSYCLDIPNGDTTDQRQLQMYACNGGDTQRFSVPGD
ncbi:RICIN domain-containing protein [Streptomyces rubellomurinus]|uniref:RICIN domain-containing protein n=1 Tax=Streptomyces rubellomurinus (strain ATCC 31215) TaxID=359131 RepID=UPI0006990515|nr:ricin-type beta-trefoil lectin domain protein [Streptomyces rubellomurinus]